MTKEENGNDKRRRLGMTKNEGIIKNAIKAKSAGMTREGLPVIPGQRLCHNYFLAEKQDIFPMVL